MCDHKWIQYEIEPVHPVSVNTFTIYMSQILKYRVTKIICVECKEIKEIAESPSIETGRILSEYQKFQGKLV